MNRFIAKIVGRPNGNGGGSAPKKPRSVAIVTKAESAPCTCPDFCERDHEND
jgi:hypothetical protein